MSFLAEIVEDINWRTSELASLRTIPFRYKLTTNHKNLLIKYTAPSIYSIWEGYIKNTFDLYIRELNNLNLTADLTNRNLLTHILSSYDKLCLENPRMNFKKKLEFVNFYQEKIGQPLIINNKLPTKSNIDFDVVNEILLRFNIDLLPITYKPSLNKLLKFRNSIAHGDSSIPVSRDDIGEFATLVIDLMTEIFTKLEISYLNQKYSIHY